ncbi:MAG: Flp pilus assembly protein CpaB [Vicinamibacterales bacterium]
MRGKQAIVISVGLGVVALVLMSLYISGREQQLLELASMKDVVVSTQDILENTVIDEQNVATIQVPSKYVQPQAVTDVREILGRVTSVAVPKSAQIVGTYLEDVSRSALAYEVPRGQRAITVAVSDVTGVGGLIRPGNYVDVMGTFQFGRPVARQGLQVVYEDEKTETRLLMQNVQVVAVEKQHRRGRPLPRTSGQEAAAGAVESAAEQQQQADVRNVTVLVAPKQAQELILAQEIGTLTMALRSTLDGGQVVDLGSLDPFGLLKVTIPLKPRERPVWREIRGGNLF